MRMGWVFPTARRPLRQAVGRPPVRWGPPRRPRRSRHHGRDHPADGASNDHVACMHEYPVAHSSFPPNHPPLPPVLPRPLFPSPTAFFSQLTLPVAPPHRNRVLHAATSTAAATAAAAHMRLSGQTADCSTTAAGCSIGAPPPAGDGPLPSDALPLPPPFGLVTLINAPTTARVTKNVPTKRATSPTNSPAEVFRAPGRRPPPPLLGAAGREESPLGPAAVRVTDCVEASADAVAAAGVLSVPVVRCLSAAADDGCGSPLAWDAARRRFRRLALSAIAVGGGGRRPQQARRRAALPLLQEKLRRSPHRGDPAAAAVAAAPSEEPSTTKAIPGERGSTGGRNP